MNGFGKCGSCDHWQKEANSDRIGSCSRWKMGYGFTYDDIKCGEVQVEYDEGWGMLSDKDFGCTLFSPASKDAANGK